MCRTRVISPDRPIARAVRAEYMSDRLTENVSKVLLLDDSGRREFRVFPAVWDAGLAALPAALGVTEEARAGQTTAKRLRREYPGAVPWGAHIVDVALPRRGLRDRRSAAGALTSQAASSSHCRYVGGIVGLAKWMPDLGRRPSTPGRPGLRRHRVAFATLQGAHNAPMLPHVEPPPPATFAFPTAD